MLHIRMIRKLRTFSRLRPEFESLSLWIEATREIENYEPDYQHNRCRAQQ